MATHFDRIPVTKSPTLGAEERRDRAKQLAWVAEVTTSPHILWDPEIMERIDELAWGIPPDDTTTTA